MATLIDGQMPLTNFGSLTILQLALKLSKLLPRSVLVPSERPFLSSIPALASLFPSLLNISGYSALFPRFCFISCFTALEAAVNPPADCVPSPDEPAAPEHVSEHESHGEPSSHRPDAAPDPPLASYGNEPSEPISPDPAASAAPDPV